jgi:isoquinoline 1-oxidoreductase subunit beta
MRPADPLAFRRKLMASIPSTWRCSTPWPRKSAGASRRRPASSRPRAAHDGFNSYVAAAAEISVKDGKEVKMHRIVGATDCGYAVNPGADRAADRGLVRLWAGALFMQECTVKDGRIVQENFDTYDSMRIAEMPNVESIIMPSGGFWGGVGEPTICVAAPAVLNAFFAATGKRIRSFPLKNHDITSESRRSASRAAILRGGPSGPHLRMRPLFARPRKASS